MGQIVPHNDRDQFLFVRIPHHAGNSVNLSQLLWSALSIATGNDDLGIGILIADGGGGASREDLLLIEHDCAVENERTSHGEEMGGAEESFHVE